MHDDYNDRDHLLAEITALRQRVARLETAEVKRRQAEETLRHNNALLRSVSQIQSELMVDADPRVSFDRLLHTLLTLTHSEYGFIGEIRHSATGDPYFKTYAITNLARHRDSQAFYERYAPDGLAFHNMQALLGAVMTTGEPVIANDPSTDPRCGGLPEGHSPLRAFLGLPVVRRGTVIGIVGIANCPGGYDQTLIEFLQPVLLTCGVIVDTYRQEQRRQQAEEALKQAHDALEARVAERTAALQHAEEEALRVSEERFRGLVEHSPSAIFLKDRAGAFRLVNKRFEEWYGVSGHDVLGKTSYDIFPPAYAAQYVAQDQAVLATGTMIEQALEVPGTDGTLYWMLVTKYPVFDNQGQPIGVGTINTDLTAHKRAVDQVRFQAQLLDSVRESVVATDLEGRITYWGKGAAALYGYGAEEVIGTPITCIVGYQMEQEEEQQRLRAVAEKGVWQGQYVQYRKDGSRFWADTIMALVTDAQGQPSGFIGIDRDISTQKAVEAALRDSRQFLQSTLDALSAHIAVLDETGTILAVNAAWRRFAANNAFRSNSHSVGMNYLSICDTATGLGSVEAARVAQGIREVIAQQRPSLTLEYTCHTHQEQQWFLMRVTCFVSSSGRRVVVAHENITERKRAEEERQHLEAQLHQVQKMEALGALAGGIAHEFNNMLAVILGYAQLATTEICATSPVSQYLQAVETAGNRAKALVQQILAFSHPSEHRREPIPLAPVIQDALKFLRASLPTTINIRQRIAPETGTVLADATQIHQVLMNLCTNAEYAMRDTGGILEVSADNIEVKDACAAFHPDLQPGVHVRVTVRDTGVGIPASVMERIFDPFFTTKGVGEGTGMGLAIVHGIVTSHDGVIAVESTPREGTTFTIYLPRLTDATPDTFRGSEPVMLQGTGRILLVDDEEVLARLGQGLLESLGYDVVIHTNSLAALETFQAKPDRFDLVITDQTMPAMTGATLVEELRRIRFDIPIILCTGFSHLMNAEKAEALGVDAFVMKPGVTQELAVTIQEVLAKRTAQET